MVATVATEAPTAATAPRSASTASACPWMAPRLVRSHLAMRRALAEQAAAHAAPCHAHSPTLLRCTTAVIATYALESVPITSSTCALQHTVAAHAGPADIDVQQLTLAEALAALADGTLTSEALTLAYLAQIAKYEPVYNAFTFFNEDALTEVRRNMAVGCGVDADRAC